MRIAIISHTYVLAANRGKLDALAALPGVELLVLVPRRWNNRDIGQSLPAEPAAGAVYSLTTVRSWQPFGFASLLVYAPWALLPALRRFQPTLLYLEEEPWSVAALEVAWCARVLRVPLAVFTWENTDHRLPWPLRWVRGFVLRTTTAAVAGSATARARLQRLGFHRPVAVIPQLGVDPERLSPAPPNSAPAVVVGYVGRLVPQKGVLVLLKACARLTSGVRLIYVGTGPLKEEILRRARATGMNGRVEVHDGVRHDQVPDYLRRFTLLAVPSLTTPAWQEQFGHVLVEAMACGIPIVASHSGAIPEVLGDAGILVPEGRADELRRAIDELLGDAARRHDLSRRGRARVLAKYTDTVVAQQLFAFLQQVVGQVG
jgi:glycosyltransferase involved in cell wall biosynthesis